MARSTDRGGFSERSVDDGRRFVERMHLPRTLGLALGAICIGVPLWRQHAHPLAWGALAVNAFVWPHIAWFLARRSRNPYRAELRNLMVDSASGGAWMAAIGLNIVPSAVLFAMLAMDKVSIGGVRFLGRCLAAQVAAAAAVALVFGFELRLESSLAETFAAVPLLVAYPITVGLTTYGLARRVRRQNLTLAALSSIDGLSGLLNRSHSEAAVANEFQRCRRIGHASALMMIDIDHFKPINDRHGHPVGDQVIRNFSRILRDSLRLQDIAGRYGGEEFVVVLPGTDARGAEALAERVRKRIESAVLEENAGVRATVSIGIAAFDRRDADPVAWISRADRALYAAKEAGRNRTVRDSRE
jgi:diguanylate cyclase